MGVDKRLTNLVQFRDEHGRGAPVPRLGGTATGETPVLRRTGGSCERCRSSDSSGVGEAGAGDYGGFGLVAAEAGAAEECAADSPTAWLVFVCSGGGSADYAG